MQRENKSLPFFEDSYKPIYGSADRDKSLCLNKCYRALLELVFLSKEIHGITFTHSQKVFDIFISTISSSKSSLISSSKY